MLQLRNISVYWKRIGDNIILDINIARGPQLQILSIDSCYWYCLLPITDVRTDLLLWKILCLSFTHQLLQGCPQLYQPCSSTLVPIQAVCWQLTLIVCHVQSGAPGDEVQSTLIVILSQSNV